MKTKRDATDAERLSAEEMHGRYLQHSCLMSVEDSAKWLVVKTAEADSEGYKAETCDCGVTMLSFHHLHMCREGDCPFRDWQGSILDRMQKSISKET